MVGGADYLGFLDAESWTGAVSLGWKGGIGDHVGYIILVMLFICSAWLAIMLTAFRDADPEAVAELNGGELLPAQGPVSYNFWPVIKYSDLVLYSGLVTHTAIFVVGLLIIIATTFELMMSAWADRATSDPVANAELRNQIMKPIEVPGARNYRNSCCSSPVFPLLLNCLKVMGDLDSCYSFQLFFSVPCASLALAEKVNRNLVATVLAFGAIALLTTGIVSATVVK